MDTTPVLPDPNINGASPASSGTSDTPSNIGSTGSSASQTGESSSIGIPVNGVPVAVPSSVNTPQAAEDADLIEKEWVEKAKHIVSSTRNDPYQQNQEINKVKADYIKKRYNKEIKVNEV